MVYGFLRISVYIEPTSKEGEKKKKQNIDRSEIQEINQTIFILYLVQSPSAFTLLYHYPIVAFKQEMAVGMAAVWTSIIQVPKEQADLDLPCLSSRSVRNLRSLR